MQAGPNVPTSSMMYKIIQRKPNKFIRNYF